MADLPKTPTSWLGELRQKVFQRDRQCVAALLDPTHACRNAFGEPHSPGDLFQMTLEHVKLNGRRIDNADNCITLCSQGNVLDHWSSANNAVANAYLAGVKAGERRA